MDEGIIFNGQTVLVKQFQSDLANVTSGSRQGSVLGLLLLVILINDLPDCVKSAIKIFANDTNIHVEIKGKLATSSYKQI